jgi:hypothetical protein
MDVDPIGPDVDAFDQSGKDIAATPSPSETNHETQILSMPIELRRSGREIKMLIEGTDPFTTAQPDARLIRLLIRARLFNAALVGRVGVPVAALAKREGVSPSYFTRLVRLSFLAPDITQAILDRRQPRDLTADKLLAHSHLPLTWHEQRRYSASLDRLSRDQLCSAKPATILDYITGTAVLEFGPAETLPQIGATSPAYARLCPTRHLHGAHTRARSRCSRPRRLLPVSDGLSAGGERIRITGPAEAAWGFCVNQHRSGAPPESETSL